MEKKMKTTTKLWTGLLIGTILTGGFQSIALADSVTGQTGSSPANVKVLDNDAPVDPLDPTKPDQDELTLESVPNAYNFETTVKNGQYTIDGTLKDQTVDVFNNRSSRTWSVKASVVNNSIIANNSAKDTFSITNFKINDIALTGTGAQGIIAKSDAAPTKENNTGLLKTAVDSASIGFTDTNNVLKAGDTLTGTISYQLYNTADAQ